MVSTCPCPSSIVPQDGVHPGKLYPNPPHAHAHAQSPHLQYSGALKKIYYLFIKIIFVNYFFIGN
jgi:hypothetical protein